MMREGSPVVFTQVAQYFNCVGNTNLELEFGIVAKSLQDLHCGGHKYRECWFKDHQDTTWCDQEAVNGLSTRANAYNNNSQHFQKQHPFGGDKEDKTFSHNIRSPMRPSREVFSDWFKVIT